MNFQKIDLNNIFHLVSKKSKSASLKLARDFQEKNALLKERGFKGEVESFEGGDWVKKNQWKFCLNSEVFLRRRILKKKHFL